MKRGAALLAGAAMLAAAAPADRVVRSIDLHAAFATRSPWRLTVTQGADMADPIMGDGGLVAGPITACLSPDGRTCVSELRDALRTSAADDPFDTSHELIRADVVHPRAGLPLLLVQLASLRSVNGNQRVVTQLFGYDRAPDRFRLAYRHMVGRNNNEEVRYVVGGALAGAVIAAEPTRDAPFGFWITVERLGRDRTYHRVLRYRSATRYGDGNPLAVIDSDMPAMQQRLGLWRPGRKLPLPPGPCPTPQLRRGALWCTAPVAPDR